MKGERESSKARLNVTGVGMKVADDAEVVTPEPEKPAATPRELADGLEEALRVNPSFLDAVRMLLSACEDAEREEASLFQEAQARLSALGKLPVEPLSSIVSMLVSHGAFAETVKVDGEPHAGTIADVFEDETISEESSVLVYVRTTEAGVLVLADTDPKKRTYEMFQGHPHLADGLLRTLELCNREGGLKTKELEALLDEEGYLYRDERTNIPHVYPSLYGNLLADAGAMRWDHAWVTTDLGREVISEMEP